MRTNNSRLRTHSNCPRKFYWTYIHGGTGIVGQWVDEKLAFGQLIHALLADYYAERDWRNHLSTTAIAEAVPGHADLPNESWAYWDREIRDWAGRIMTEYEKWASVNDRFSVIQVECEGHTPLGSACHSCGHVGTFVIPDHRGLSCGECGAEWHELVFKLDLLINYDGSATFMDHKTTSGIGPAYLEKWAYEPQMQGYTLGTRSVGHPARKFMMNFIRKLKTIGIAEDKTCPSCKNGAKKKEGCPTCAGVGRVAKPPVDVPFLQKPYIVVEEALARFEINRIRQCNDIAAQLKVHPSQDPLELWPMRTDACFDYGRCPYIRLCYSGNPEFWYEPAEELTQTFVPRPKDYVMEREEES